MEFSFNNDEFVENIIKRRGEENAKEIFLELRKRYAECEIREHLVPIWKKNTCAYCFRTLGFSKDMFQGEIELQEIADWYAGLIALENARFKKKSS